jgi:hypothetical protein
VCVIVVVVVIVIVVVGLSFLCRLMYASNAMSQCCFPKGSLIWSWWTPLINRCLA